MPVDKAWLAQHREPILEPDLPICDPHHHLWDYPGSRYLLQELLADTGAGHRVTSTVFVECLSAYRETPGDPLAPVGETEFVEQIAEASAADPENDTTVAAGIVAFADLLLGERVNPVLEAHRQASPTRFRGIRHACSWDASDEVRNSHTNPPPHLYLNPEFRAGFAELGKHELVFDAWLYHTQLEELLDLARAFPRQVIVLDHVGGPLGIGPYRDRREEVFRQWSQGIAALASCPNVRVKLGGLAMAINGFDWHKRSSPPTSAELVEANRPYLEFVLEKFGVDRCMFESNFPVDKVSCSYEVLWNAFKRFASDYSPAEKALLFHDVAASTYSLTESRSAAT